jgi:hypothetical protein
MLVELERLLAKRYPELHAELRPGLDAGGVSKLEALVTSEA